jgi:hypothetical protein
MSRNSEARIKMLEGKKFDENKLEWNLLPFDSLEELVKIYMLGKNKYGFENWKKGFTYNRLFDAAMRHLLAWKNKQDLDEESGLNHLMHCVWNCVTLFWMQKNNIGEDNR